MDCICLKPSRWTKLKTKGDNPLMSCQPHTSPSIHSATSNTTHHYNPLLPRIHHPRNPPIPSSFTQAQPLPWLPLHFPAFHFIIAAIIHSLIHMHSSTTNLAVIAHAFIIHSLCIPFAFSHMHLFFHHCTTNSTHAPITKTTPPCRA